MFKKLTTLCVSAILTVGLVAAAAPPVDTRQDVKQKMEKISNQCAEAFLHFKFKNDKGKRLEEIVATYPDSEKPIVLLICYGYGKGFNDAWKVS